MMPDEHRRTARAPCRIPVRIQRREGPLDATVLDLSCDGVRLRVAPSELGLHRLASVVRVAQVVHASLEGSFEAVFHPDRLGNLIARRLEVVRIGQRDWTTGDVELGCRIEVPFGEMEAAMLGVALPGEGESAEAAAERRPANGPVEHSPGERAPPAHTAGASLAGHPAAPSGAAGSERTSARVRALAQDCGTLEAEVETADVAGLVLRVDDIAPLALAPGIEGNGPAVVMAFDARYGGVVAIEVRRGERTLWDGQARLSALEVLPTVPAALRMGFTFTTPLTERERDALGVPAR